MARRKVSDDSQIVQQDTIDDKGLRQFAGYHLKRAYNVFRSDLSTVLEPLGLRITTYSALILIVDNPGIRQSELAAALDIERPNMVVILDDLEQNGWINRERLETDRRVYALYATLTGRQLCQKAISANRKIEAARMNRLEERDVRKMVSTLNAIERIEEDGNGF